MATRALYFNPRLPRERRLKQHPLFTAAFRFQSTPPAREATSRQHWLFEFVEFQSTPPAREATYDIDLIVNMDNISIHASRERGDTAVRFVRGCLRISIHASRERGDSSGSGIRTTHGHFNPRLPRERRHPTRTINPAPVIFQSTPPAREATFSYHILSFSLIFQSTPPAREATWAKSFYNSRA